MHLLLLTFSSFSIVHLTFVIIYLIINLGMASFFFMELLASPKRSDIWYGNLIKTGVLTANAVAFLIDYATYSLRIWTF